MRSASSGSTVEPGIAHRSSAPKASPKVTDSVATAVRPRPETVGRSDENRAVAGVRLPQQPHPSVSSAPDASPTTSAVHAHQKTSHMRWRLTYSRALPAVDAAVAGTAAAVSLAVLAGSRTAFTAAVAVVGFMVALLVSTASARCYDVHTITHPREIPRVATAVMRVAALLGVIGYLTSSAFIGPLLLVALPCTWLLLVLVRLGARARLRRLQARGEGRRKVLVVGTERASAELIVHLGASTEHAFDVVGVLTEASVGDTVEGVPVLGTASRLRDAVHVSGATTVLVAPWSPISQDGVRRLSWESAELGVEFFLSPNVVDVDGSRIQVEMAAGVPFLKVQHPQFGGAVRRLQSFLDRLIALVALALLSPVVLVTALAIRFTSPGGALFRQERVGQGGQHFGMYKFRSMHVDAEARRDEVLHQNKHGVGPMFKSVTDPRITRVGKFLRRFSLDELPQLWNVAKGDMALVGPRPPLPVEVAQYDSATLRRLLVRPGLTGLWQVSGRSDLPWEESIRLDLYYVDNRSVGADLAIIGRTGSAVFAGRGAY